MGYMGSRVMLAMQGRRELRVAMQGMVRNARMCDASVFFLSGALWLPPHSASPLRPHFPTLDSQGLGGDYYSTSAGQREKMLTATQVWGRMQFGRSLVGIGGRGALRAELQWC